MSDLGQCTKKVGDYTGFHFFPCSRKAKEIVGGRTLCRQHAKKAAEQLERVFRIEMKRQMEIEGQA